MLPCSSKHVIFDDTIDTIYYPTKEGLCRFKKDERTIIPYPEKFAFVSDNLEDEITSFSFVSAAGSIFLATKNGDAVVFSEDDISPETTPKQSWATRFHGPL